MNRRFLLDLFVVDHSGTKVPVNMFGATEQDIEKTDSWMTYWGSDYFLDSKHENYAMKSKDDELIALVSYEIMKNRLVVHIVYMESQPESNPVITQDRKYRGIGKALIAFGIKLSVEHGFGGDVILEPKTDELKAHYVNDFSGIVLPSFKGDIPCSILIADNAAVNIVSEYIAQEE